MNLEETEDMARYLLEIREELDLAMVLVEHDMHIVMDIADRVMALDFGAPITIGTPPEVQATTRGSSRPTSGRAGVSELPTLP